MLLEAHVFWCILPYTVKSMGPKLSSVIPSWFHLRCKWNHGFSDSVHPDVSKNVSFSPSPEKLNESSFVNRKNLTKLFFCKVYWTIRRSFLLEWKYMRITVSKLNYTIKIDCPATVAYFWLILSPGLLAKNKHGNRLARLQTHAEEERGGENWRNAHRGLVVVYAGL